MNLVNYSTRLVVVFWLSVASVSTWATYPNRIKDAEDELFGQSGPLASTGVPTWAVSEPYINLWLFDQPLTYTTSYSQSIGFGVAYKQRDYRSNSKVFGLGPSWQSSWLSYTEYTTSGGTVTAGTNYVRLGGARMYVADGATKEFKSIGTMAKLTDGGGNFAAFQISSPSGAKETYGYLLIVSASENYAFLSEQIDSIGRTNRFVYDTIGGVVRLRQMIDSDTRTSTVRYLDSSFDKQITEVEDPYGRKAKFAYDGNGRVQSIINVGNLTNSFGYDGQGLITNLTTVYGTTSFKSTTNQVSSETLGGNNQVNRSLEVTLPDANKQLFLYRDQSTKLNSGSTTDLIPTSYSSGEVPNTSVPNPPALANTFDNSYQDARNSFSWNAKQYAALSASFRGSGNFNDLTLGDYMIASRRHWLRRYNNDDVVVDTVSLEQAASPEGTNWGQKLWYDYAAKAGGNWCRGTNVSPRFAALVLPDGNTRYTYSERNQWEKTTRIVDTYSSGSSVAARTNKFVFASNGIDLIEWRGPSNELLSSNAYNGFHQIVTSFNAVNDRTDFTYNSAGRLTGIQWPSALVTTNFYYSSGTNLGWLQSSVDFDAATGTPFRTNSINSYFKALPASSTDARGLTVDTTWDDLQRPSTVTVPAGTYTSQYNKLDLEKVIDPLQSTNRFTFDAMEHLSAVIDSKGTNAFKYLCGWLCHSTNALQQVEKYDYDLNGHMIAVTYPDTSVLNLKFNLLGQLTNRIDALNATASFFYNNQGLVSSASNAFGQVLLRKYDLRDRPITEVNANGVSTTNTYDNLSRLLTRSYPDGGVEKFEYSVRGLIAYTNQLGFVTRYGYDALGRRLALTNANSEVLRYAYTAAGDLISFTDGKSQAVQFGYDVYGRLASKTNAAGAEILRFKYDAAGRMTNRWTIGKGDVFYSYDSANNLTNINYAISPDISFGYDPLHRITNMVDGYSGYMSPGSPNSAPTVFAFTSFGDLRTEDGPLANDTVTYDYHTNHIRFALSMLQKSGTNWVQSYGYDAALRLNAVASPAGLFTNIFSSGVLGGTTCGSALIQKIVYPGGAYVTNSFDSVARLAFTKLKTSGHLDLNVHSYLYNTGNQRSKQTRTDGSYVDYGYDGVGQLRSASGKESGGTSRLNEQLSYGYDAAWNLQSRTNNALVQTFTANSRNQLTGISRNNSLTVAGNTSVTATNVTINGVTATRYGDNTYVKDGFSLASGNNTFTVIAQDSYGRGDTNVITANLPATVNFTCDSNGNLTSDGLRGFEYDDENQLTRITVTNSWKSEFVYDGLGRRRVRNESVWFNGAWAWTTRVWYVYDGNVVAHERWDGDEPPVNYTRGSDASGSLQGGGGIGGLLARSANISAVPQHHYYHSDGNGNVTALINASQQVTAKYLYDPFGRVIASSGFMADVNLYRFSSKEAHENSGLISYGLRFYDPSLQRWLNGDPLKEGGGINLYRFCGGDPINAIDPWGLDNIYRPLAGQNAPVNVIASRPISGGPVEVVDGGTDYLLSILPITANPAFGLIMSPVTIVHGIDDAMDPTLSLPERIGGGLTAGGTAILLFAPVANLTKPTSLAAPTVRAANPKGSGPSPGLLEISDNFTSTKAVQRFRSPTPANFVFDAKTGRFVIGTNETMPGKSGVFQRGHPETALEAGIKIDSQVVGGSIRFIDGKLVTDERSGRLGLNWTPEIRTQYLEFMGKHGIDIEHIPWK